MPMSITYADNGAAVAADTTAQILMTLDPGLTASTAPFRFNTAMADLVAQEAMIDYGLQHSNPGEPSIGNPFSNSDVDLLTGSDVMRDGPQEAGQPFPSLGNMDFFTRLPMMVGDFNQVQALTQNAYDQLTGAVDIGILPAVVNTSAGTTETFIDGGSLADIIGPNPIGVGYVTGTGAFDHISLVNDTATGMIDVTVDAYRDASFDPSSLITTFSYTIDPTTITELIIEAGNSNDQIDVDPTIVTSTPLIFQVFGGGGTNNFSMQDNGSDTVQIVAANLDALAYSGVDASIRKSS